MAKGWIAVIGIILIVLLSWQFLVVYPSEKTVNITVKEKWIKYHDSDAYYLFSDTDGNVYKCSDDVWYMKWDSSDYYAVMVPNQTYEVKTAGWRTRWMSEYPNIVGARPV